METAIIILMLLVLAAVVVQYVQSNRRQPDASVSTALQNLTQTVQGTHTQAAVLSEKVGQIEELPTLVGDMKIELRGLSERLSTVETMLSASHRCEQPDVIAARHARDSSSLEGLQKIIAKAREDATQVKTFNAYLRWAPFRKGLQLSPGI